MLWCKENNKRGLAAINSGKFLLIKDLRTMNNTVCVGASMGGAGAGGGWVGGTGEGLGGDEWVTQTSHPARENNDGASRVPI